LNQNIISFCKLDLKNYFKLPSADIVLILLGKTVWLCHPPAQLECSGQLEIRSHG